MPLPALQKFERGIERQLRLLEVRKTVIERKIERQIRVFEEKRGGIGKKIEEQIRQFERKRGIRIDDEVRFIRSWIERPLTHRRGDAFGKNSRAHHGALCRSGQQRTGGRARARHRPGD